MQDKTYNGWANCATWRVKVEPTIKIQAAA